MHKNVLDNLKKYKLLCEEYNREKENAAKDLLWFEENNIKELNLSIESIIIRTNHNNNLLREKNQNLSDEVKKIKHVQNKLGLFPHIRSWFGNKELKVLLNNLRLLKESRNSIKNEIKSIDARVRHLIKSHEDANSRIARYLKLENEDIQKVYGEACIKLIYAKKEFSVWEDEYNKYKNYYDDLAHFEEEIKNLKDDIKVLKQFSKKLYEAPSSYHRKMIHDECDKIFGDGNPNLLIRECERKISEKIYYRKQKEIELKKAKTLSAQKKHFNIREKIGLEKLFPKEINKENKANNSNPRIKKIVIDGSNLIYEKDKYIGAQALAWLTQNLRKQYDLIVVFDNGAYLSLGFDKTSSQELEEKLFGYGVIVHRVQKERKADDTILKYAENEKSCYVLSNDRFRDYPDAEAVLNKRIIRHEILGGKIIIHDLDVSLSYT